ncbi:MAG: hypothetical protein ACYDB7_14150 [Mycobacteriales bacterium]
MASLPAAASLFGRAALPVPGPLPGIPALPGIPTVPGGGTAPSLSGAVAGALGQALRQVLGQLLHGFAEPLANYLLHTPDLLAEPTLRTLWLASLGCLLALAAALVGVTATGAIAGSNRFAAAAREALGVRLVAGILTAALALPLVALEVELANALVGVFLPLGAGPADTPVVSALLAAVSGSASAQLGVLVVAAVGALLLGALAVIALLRWATLWLLVVLSPLVEAAGLLPGGTPVVRLWWRLQFGTVFLPVAQAVLLASYGALFSSDRTGFTGALAGVAVLALLARLPAWAAGQAVHLSTRDVLSPLRRAAIDTARFAPARSRPPVPPASRKDLA